MFRFLRSLELPRCYSEVNSAGAQRIFHKIWGIDPPGAGRSCGRRKIFSQPTTPTTTLSERMNFLRVICVLIFASLAAAGPLSYAVCQVGTEGRIIRPLRTRRPMYVLCNQLLEFSCFRLISLGAPQTGCNALVVSCYAAAGLTFGTVTAGAATPAVVIGCNAGLGTCMAACVAAGCSPIP